MDLVTYVWARVPSTSLTKYRLRDNESAFDRYQIRPRILRNVEHVDMSTRILGTKVQSPIPPDRAILTDPGISSLWIQSRRVAETGASRRRTCGVSRGSQVRGHADPVVLQQPRFRRCRRPGNGESVRDANVRIARQVYNPAVTEPRGKYVFLRRITPTCYSNTNTRQRPDTRRFSCR
jgi:hypothetical protein